MPAAFWLLHVVVMGLLGCGAPDALTVGFVGCDEVLRDAGCALSEEKMITILARAPPGTELALEAESGTLSFTCDGASVGETPCKSTQEETALRVRLPAKPMELRLVTRRVSQLMGRTARLRIEPRAALPAWLEEARTLRIRKDQPAASEKTIRAALEQFPNLSAALRARAHSELAHALQEQLRLKEATETVAQAVALDEEAGLLSAQSADLFFWADMLQDQRQLLRLEQLLNQSEALVSSVAADRPWLALYRAQARQAMGDPERALRQLDEADRWNLCCGDVKSQSMAVILRTSVLVELGRAQESQLVAQSIQSLSAYPCRLGLLLRRQAHMRLQALESISGEGLPLAAGSTERLQALWEKWESDATAGTAERHAQRLRELLESSLSALLGRGTATSPPTCAQPRHLALVMLTQARLALLMGRANQAKEILETLQRQLAEKGIAPERSPLFSVEWNRLMAQLARAEHRFDAALQHAEQIERFAGDDVSSFEVRFAARMARALALIDLRADADQGATRRGEVLMALRSAQEVLEEASHSAPQFLGRGPLLGRFEWGTRLLLEQLLNVDENERIHANQETLEEALLLIRHVRTRGLRELRILDRLSQLDPATRKKWEAAVTTYLSARHEVDQAVLAEAPRRQLLEENARQQLTAALQLLGEQYSIPQRRMPTPGEAFLACHPLRQRWLCLLADSTGIAAETLSPPDPQLAPEKQAAELLGPFRAQLERAHVLSVFGYGALREVAIHLLPFEGKPLGNRLIVRYSLDLSPREPPHHGDAQPAMVVIDHQLEREAQVQLAEPILASLRRSQRFRPQHYEMEQHGTLAGASPSSFLEDFRQRAGTLGMLQLFGHADYASENGWIHGVTLSPWRKLTAGDVLVLSGVPRQVLLIACQSGASGEVSGGQEALGLAQAFLIRGSQEVLATTRTVTAPSGALLLRAVNEYLAANPDAGLAVALSAALEQLRAAQAGGELESPKQHARLAESAADWDAFRVFVP